MRRLPVLSVFVALMFVVSLLVSFVNYNRGDTRENQQERLRRAVNKAVDAAVDEMIMRSGNTESVIPEKIMYDPQVALDEFVDMLLMYYGLPTNEANRYMVKTRFISVFMVVTYDGYYVARSRQIASGANGKGRAFDLSFDPKMPYTYVYDPNNPDDVKYVSNPAGNELLLYHETTPARYQNNTIYNLVLNSMYYYKIDPYSNITFNHGAIATILNKPHSDNPLQLTDANEKRAYLEKVRSKINFIVIDALKYHSEAVNKGNSNWAKSVNIPLYGGTNVNPIFGPSVLVLMQDVMLESTLKLDIASIGGSVVIQTEPILGYVANMGTPGSPNWVKMYCHSDELPAGITPTQTFPDARSAALAGYQCDVRVWNVVK